MFKLPERPRREKSLLDRSTKSSSSSTSTKLPPLSKKKLNISHLGKVAPLNISDQQELFFKQNCLVNPIFSYQQGSNQLEYINKFKVSSRYLYEATRILENCLRDFGSETRYFESDGGKQLSKEETTDSFNVYMENLNLPNMMTLVFSKEAIAPTAINYNARTHKCTATISLPIVYREKRISGVLHHEIGTHLIRSLNDKKQLWNNKRHKFNLKAYVETEEGIATIHTNIENAMSSNSKPYLWSAALHYYASFKASQMSFVELYADLEKFIDNPIRRFKETLRVKRGMNDTSKPGGCYKDQVYLSGAIKVLQARWRIDFKELYAGKIALEDYFREDIRKIIRVHENIMPKFMENMEEYRKGLDNVAKTNGIDFV